MHLAILPLSVACLALLSSVANEAPLKVLSSPNLLRIGATENIFVECQGCSGANLNVQILVKNFPTEISQLDTTTVTLTQQNKFQAFGAIKIPAGAFRDDPELKQHVSLEAKFSDGTNLKKVVLVTFQSGYIFIQTDKPLYTPDAKVHYRVFALTPGMKPINDEDDGSDIIKVHIMSPDDVIFGSEPVSLKSGMYSGIHRLPDIVSTGVWKVVATFENNKRHNYSSEFEVKEYVLPSFEVKITPDKNFFYVDDKQLTVDIQATYTFGKEVDGTAYVIFGIFHENKEKNIFPGSIKSVPIQKGKGKATLKREVIQETHDIENLVNCSIYIAVAVLTESGSEMVEAEKQGIRIVESPYTIHFKYTSKYFKPTMPFEVVVYVENPDGSPAPDVPLLVDPGSIPTMTAQNGIARVPINMGNRQIQIITARTNDEHILERRQTLKTMVAHVYTSNTQNYLHIGVSSPEIRLGDDLRITMQLSERTSSNFDLTYLIQSRGQLVKYGHKTIEGFSSIAMMLRVTKEMLPSFRIIAYYQKSGEVVSDSVWVDVVDRCMGSLRLEETRNVPSFTPRQTFRYKITGDPGATVGLVAVDQGVYALNNKHRLTQKKVWDIVEKADTGCTPGGGMNSMNVFHDAGLLFQSNIIGQTTDERKEFKCPVSTRTKRASHILDVRTTLLSEYTDTLQRQCCLDGMGETPLSYSCERRKEYISDGNACAEAFLKCCQKIARLQTESKTEALYLARSDEKNIEFTESGQITTRTEFPESWLWAEHQLPLCSDDTTNCKTTSFEKTTVLKDSITTWHLTGISLSPTHGICIDDTFKMVVQKDLFIDLRLPYSAVRGEQIEIKAIVHNYQLEDITVQVSLKETEHVCSSASNKGEYTQEIKVGAGGTRSVPFIIIPMEHGTKPIKVTAFSGNKQDSIQKKLKVVPEGILIKDIVSKDLNPAKYNGKQVETITNPIDTKHIVPKTPWNTRISVTGGVQMLVEKVLDGSYMSSLISQPSGCGEQNLAKMTLPLIATTYLDKTNQWDRVGTSKRDAARAYLQTGYKTQLRYRKGDGSFAIFPQSHSSSWLTAYAAKVFAMAYTLVDIDITHICDAIRWVIKNSQMLDGSFKELGKVDDRRIQGGMRGPGLDFNDSMTAFSLIAMQEAQLLCTDSVNNMNGSINKAVGYLEKRLPALTNPYAVAMVSYALAVANKNKFNKEILYKFAPDSTHWPVANHKLFTLEATAYALLALVKVEEFEDAAQIVKWLNTQRTVGGGYESTQSTTMVYQALAEYWVNAQEKYDKNEMDIEIQYQIPGRSESIPFKVNKGNAFETRTTGFKGINQEVNVTAKGTGEATISVVSLYYKRPTTDKTLNNCEKFELNVELIPEHISEDGNKYLLKIEILYKDINEDADMTILDIGLLTGYMPDVEDLNKLHKGRDRTISKYEMDKVLSDRGSLIIYLDKVSHKRRDEVAFKIKQTVKVGVLQPAAISIYEFYNPKHCVTFYHPARDQGQILRLCQDDVCKCAEEECSMQQKGKISNQKRNQNACDAEVKIDYVYQVTMESFEDHKATDVYMMRINQVIKEGSIDVEPEDKLRSFIGYSHCREVLDLEPTKSYLIMGTAKDTTLVSWEIGEKQYQYVLGENTWIEYWPTEVECQTPEYGPTCEGMADLIFTFSFKGCED